MKSLAIHLLLFHFLSLAKGATDDDELLENRVSCLDKSLRYRKRPEKQMQIYSEVAILSIDSISAAKMELSADVYLVHEWRDSRCQWRPLPRQGNVLTLYARPGEGSTWTHAGLNNLWQPDTHVLNAKKLSRPETVTHIYSHGTVVSRTRLSLVTSCPMDLKMYPMDRQVCQLTFQSSAHPSKELTYLWKNSQKLTFVQGLAYQDKMTPDFQLLGYKLLLDEKLDEITTQNFTQFSVRLYLERPIGYFLWEVYMPASFIVFMSFTSFWLDRSAIPARVSLGVTTVLTMTTLLSSANSNLPPTAYPKSIGVFLAGCFFFTFLAMIEFAVASFLEKRKTSRRLIKMSRTGNSRRNMKIESDKSPLAVECESAPSLDDKFCSTENSAKLRARRPTLGNLKEVIKTLRPASVDLYSRYLFPMAFVSFLLTYWLYLICSWKSLSVDFIPFERN